MNYKSLFALFCLICSTTVATADTVTVTLDDYNDTPITATIQGFGSKTYKGGVMKLGSTEEGVFTTATKFQGKVAAFCIDLAENISGSATFTVVDDIANTPSAGGGPYYWEPMGANKAKAIRQLWSHAFPTVTAGVSAETIASTAFQIALHEIIYEGDGTSAMYGLWDITSGWYDVTDDGKGGSAATLAQNWLNSLTTNSSLANLKALSAPTSDTPFAVQDLIFEVPSPSSFVGLTGLAIAGLFVRYRRNRRD